MARARRYWLMKVEPETYSIADLERDGTTVWEGIRNYRARNLLRDEAQGGDLVLFYASSADPSGVAGIAEVARGGYPDPFQFQKGHHYYDPKSRPEDPSWFAVDLRFVERFPEVVPLETLKRTPGLEEMWLTTPKGTRLSVQPVTKEEFAIVRRLGKGRGSSRSG